MNPSVRPMGLLVSIVERGKAALLIRHYQSFQLSQHLQAAGRGTAASHLLDTLGFGTAERDVVLTLGPRQAMARLMAQLKDQDRSQLGARGIAFSLPLSGMSAVLALALSRPEPAGSAREGEENMEEKNPHSLILVAVNQGYTDAVMDTARAAGARGGTVIRARWAEAGEIQKLAGITLQAEKEVLAIVATEEDRNAIMEAIDKGHGLRTPDQAMVISLPVDQTARLD